MQFYTGDWLKSPDLTICSPETRGIWMDFLCVMHERDRSGVIAGTREQLARLGRCSAVHLDHALSELQTSGAASVTERSGIVTVLNRRMNREAKEREANALRQARHRGSKSSNGLITSLYEDEDEDEVTSPKKRSAKFSPPKVAEVAAYCLERHNGIDAEAFVAYYESKGWKVGNAPMKSWRSAIITWEKNKSLLRTNGDPGKASRKPLRIPEDDES